MFEGKDYISRLPDETLVSIISRLPTRTAVSTSILSNRWRNLYKFISSIHLRCTDLVPPAQRDDPDSHSRFVFHRLELLLRLISSSDHHAKIHTFDLTCFLDQSIFDLFKQCIHHLAKSSVEKLDLSLSCFCHKHNVFFPFYFLLLELPSLKFLSLNPCTLRPLPNLNTKHHSLQTLQLYHSRVVDGFLESVLSNCLSLVSLALVWCKCPRKLCFRGSPLKTLKIHSCNDADEIELHLENLSKFEFRSWRVATVMFDHVPHLQTLSFGRFNVLFKQLPHHIQFLTFDIVGRLSQPQEMIKRPMVFGKLKRLDINVLCKPTTNLLELAPYLESCPVLEELHLKLQESCVHLQNMKGWNVGVETRIHRKLIKVEMRGFCGMNNEMEFLSYILKSAIALEELRIDGSFNGFCGSQNCFLNLTKWTKETLEDAVQPLQGQALSNAVNFVLIP